MISWSNPQPILLEETIDTIEISNVYDDRGRKTFTQIIFRDWNPKTEYHEIVAWRMITSVIRIDKYNKIVYLSDTKNEVVPTRKVHYKNFIETWTFDDPELKERARLPKSKRRELLNPKFLK